jgi:hypothetical protein
MTDWLLYFKVISGARAFDLLSPEQKEFALNTTVQYAPRAYEWIRDCRATSDGLGIARVGDERKEDELPEWSWDKVQAFPVRLPLLLSPLNPSSSLLISIYRANL